MNTSNAAVQTSSTEAQKGFSLIELLVVVAIIGVLAAAGIVGYQSYLDGVKKDTQINNAQAVFKAMQLAVTAANSGLSGHSSLCKSTAIRDDDAAKLCIVGDSSVSPAIPAILDGLDKWKSPFGGSYSGADYFVTGNACQDERIAVSVASGKVILKPCDKPAGGAASAVLQRNNVDAVFEVNLQ